MSKFIEQDPSQLFILPPDLCDRVPEDDLARFVLEWYSARAFKALRLDLARERGVPADVVFPDRTLTDMPHRRPPSEAEFAAVNGVGAAKLEQFAEPFLAAIEAALPDTGDGGTIAEGAR